MKPGEVAAKNGLRGDYRDYVENTDNPSLRGFFALRRRIWGSVRHVAVRYKISHGLITYVLNGGNSPALNKLAGATKHPRRWRIIIPADEELYNRFVKMIEEKGISREAWTEKKIEEEYEKKNHAT